MNESSPQTTQTPTVSSFSPPPTISSQIKPSNSRSSNIIAILACLFAVIAIAASGFAYTTATGKVAKDKQTADVNQLQDKIKKLEDDNNYEQLAIDNGRFQAVFLSSGQVYFGKISEVKKDTIKLENIYYLRNGKFDKSGNISDGADVSLAKLGNELHGPDDIMYIERKNLEFWENLKDDSQVVKAIKEYEKTNKN